MTAPPDTAPTDAELLAAFRSRAAFDPSRGSVRPWLFGIATNLVARHRRTETRRYRALLDRQRPEDPHPPLTVHASALGGRAVGTGEPGLDGRVIAAVQTPSQAVRMSAAGSVTGARRLMGCMRRTSAEGSLEWSR